MLDYTNSFSVKPEQDPICPYCGIRPLKFIKYAKVKQLYVYHSNCGCKECASKQRKEKTTKTLEALYGPGVTNNWQSPKTKETMYNTKLERHGDPYWSNPEKTSETQRNKTVEEKEVIKQKSINTCREKYGCDYATQSQEIKNEISVKVGTAYKERHDEILEKRGNTCEEKYGYRSASSRPEYKQYMSEVMKTPEVLEKREQTCIKIYGFTNPMLSITTKIKLMINFCNRFNVDIIPIDTFDCIEDYLHENLSNVMKSPEYRNLCNSGMLKNLDKSHRSKEEKQLFTKLSEIFNDIVIPKPSEEYPWKCDMYIPSKKLYIEYQGGFYHNFRPYTGSEEDLQEISVLLEKSADLKLRSGVDYTKYDNKIYQWSDLDVRKRTWAKEHNLNFLEIWPKYNLNEVIKQINEFETV